MKIEQFWEEKEKEIGEKIIYKCLIEYLSGYQNFSGPIWGLFFYTKEALYFQTFPKKSWYSSLFWTKKEEDWGSGYFNFRIPWQDIQQITFPEKKSLIQRIFSSASIRIKLEYLYQNKSLVLNLIFNSERDVEALKETSSLILFE